MQFDIFTDSSCDLPKDIIEKFDLKVMQLEVHMNDNPPVLNNQIDVKEFYEALRNGANAKTNAVTLGQFEENMRQSLSEGKDILYLGFSSGLSATYNNGAMVMEDLRQEFPDKKLYDVDTLCATMGQGLLVYYAAKLREEGLTIEAVRDRIEAIKDNIHHEVTVNDLFFLKRGGRISATTAIAGTMLGVKPIIAVDKEGKLNTVGKVRGRKTAIAELFKKMKSNENLEELNYAFISHSDCLDDAKTLEAMVKEEFPGVLVEIGDIGPVIGAHTGPGALVICYMGKTIKGM